MNTIAERENPEITKRIESFLLDTFSDNPDHVYSTKELESSVKGQLQGQYGTANVAAHVAWALDMLHSNQMIKRVGPGQWQSSDGPDPVYSDRLTGYSPEGEFSRRGRNFLANMGSSERKKFNKDVESAILTVKILKSAGYDQKKIYDFMTKESTTKFNPVAIKIAIKKAFALPGTSVDGGEDEIDPSIFNTNDVEFAQ